MEHPEAGSGLDDLTKPLIHTDKTSSTLGRTPSRSPIRMDNGVTLSDVSFCASPADTLSFTRKPTTTDSKETLGGMLRRAIEDHQLGLSLNIILLLALTYTLFPSLRHDVEPFFSLQYVRPDGMCSQGPRDIWLVFGFVVLFTGLRAACMDYFLTPLAGVLGIKKKKSKVRFAEQSYLLLYYTVFWTWGLVLFVSDTPKLTSTTILGKIDEILMSIWRDYPRLTSGPSIKLYYLSQTAFWIQQIVVIHIEERRKDHWQMLTHHFVTVGLLFTSFADRQMRAGNAILVLMDVVDLVFPLAKILRYLGMQTACDIAFGVFVVTWLFARHISYLAVLWSLYSHVDRVTHMFGTFSTTTSEMISRDAGTAVFANILQPFLNPAAETVQWSWNVRAFFFGLLGGLQVITCIWFVMICRVVARVLRGEGADDSRSDDEEDGEEEDFQQEIEEGTEKGKLQNGSASYKLRPQASQRPSQQARFIEVPAEAQDLYYGSSRPALSHKSSGSKKRSKGISSGLNLGEHKEILNRIGCLSDEQLARESERRQESASPRPGSSNRG